MQFTDVRAGGSNDRPALDTATVLVLAFVAFAAHAVTNRWGPYEYHRDEFLYVAMGRHLRLWHMDFPPAIALLANLSRALFGDSVVTIRTFPALAHSALVVAAALIARELGGRRAAQLIAALAVLTSPLFLRAGNLFQPVVFDQLWWTLALFVLLRLVRSGDGRWWLALGGTLGVGLLTKFSIVFIGVPLVIAILLTPERRWLATRWPWMALAIALALGSPSLAGQIALGFPLAVQMDALRGSQLERVTYAAFIGGQLLLGPAFLLAAGGAVALAAWKPLRDFRVAGYACIGAFVFLLLLHGKSYYVGPIYPTLFAAGATALESVRGKFAPRAVRGAVVILVIAYGAIVLPLSLPAFSPALTARHAQRLGVSAATATNQGVQLALPQDYADMLGWREMVRAVADAYATLPANEREEAVLIGENYGEAGALELYGPRYGLPPVVSAAGSFWFFGPGERPGRVVVTLGVSKSDLSRFYGEVQDVARFDSWWMVPEERHVEILIGRSPRQTLQQVWPSLAGRN